MDKVWSLVRDYWQYVAMGVLAALVLGTWGWAQWRQSSQITDPVVASTNLMTTSSHSASVVTTVASASTGAAGYVYVAGAVRHPGLYHVRSTTRWADVVQAAGGLTDDADASQVNLARFARDQENLTIPVQGALVVSSSSATDVSNAAATGASGVASGAADTDQIDLNTATLAQLQTISGVGPKRAQDIIDYRSEHGGFQSVDQLKDISGIGDKIFADLQPHVTVGSTP
ncbi:helix-hairpin-helix domain-containing protein [Lacticaseibacillus thailandensis]|nr:helix-hairpin-helix domain-containing protein [Lacticaseibacillus thailandensis]